MTLLHFAGSLVLAQFLLFVPLAPADAAELAKPGEVPSQSNALPPGKAEPPPLASQPTPEGLTGAFALDTGAGPVLCVWGIFLTVKTIANRCQLPETSADAPIDDAIAAMDTFILA